MNTTASHSQFSLTSGRHNLIKSSHYYYYYYYYYYSTMALANKDDPISNGVIYCYEVSVDLGALNRSRWRRE